MTVHLIAISGVVLNKPVSDRALTLREVLTPHGKALIGGPELLNCPVFTGGNSDLLYM